MAADTSSSKAKPKRKTASSKKRTPNAKAAPKKKPTAKKKPAAKKKAAPKKKAAAKPRKPKTKAKPKSKTRSSKPRGLMARILRWTWIAGVALVCVGLLSVVLTVGWVVTYRFVDPPVTALMLTRSWVDGLPRDHVWRDLDRISPHMALAVIAAEDQRFPEHNGFDWVELEAAWEDYRDGGRLRGASTISQQTAKNAFLWPARAWLRKGLEAYFTVLVEQVWPKQRILEVYLNIAEMGPGLYGAEAAAQAFFQKPAEALSREEAARLAAVLPNPRRYRADSPSDYVLGRQAWILKQMHNLGGVDYLDRVVER